MTDKMLIYKRVWIAWQLDGELNYLHLWSPPPHEWKVVGFQGSALCRYFWLLSWGAPNWTHGLPQSQVHQPSRWLYIGPSTLRPPVGSCPIGSLLLQPWVQPQPGNPANPRVHLSPSSSVLSDMWSSSQMPLWAQDAFCPHRVVSITGQWCDTNVSNRKKNY